MAYPMTPPDPTAVVGKRIVAFLIDLCLVGALALAAAVPAAWGSLETAPESEVECNATDSGTSFDDLADPDQEDPSFCFSTGDGEVRYLPVAEEGRVSVVFYGAALGVGLLNSVLLQGLTGASLGKLALGLRVIRKDGQRANVGWNLLRWVLLLVGTLFCCIGWIIDLVMVFATKGHRRVGDFAATTFVVGKEAMGTPPQIPGVTAPAGAGYPPAGSFGGQPGAYPPPAGPPTAPGDQPAWSPPPTTLPPVVPETSPTEAMPGADGPTWDEARDAYIQYDRELGEWVQWDAQQNRWRPIDQ